MSDSIVKITNLGKIYQNGAKKLEVLKGINLEVKKEELLVIQGPSGAGKSTLLHLMGGLDKPTKGSVFVNGFNLGRYWDVGPQRTLYLPGPLLIAGANTIVVFELEGTETATISFRDTPILDRNAL